MVYLEALQLFNPLVLRYFSELKACLPPLPALVLIVLAVKKKRPFYAVLGVFLLAWAVRQKAGNPVDEAKLEHWREKIVLVTGPATGIGLAAAEQFAGMGVGHLVLAGRKERGPELLKHLRDLNSPSQRITFMELDLSSLGSVESFAKSFAESFPRLDVLILNAGVGMGSAPSTHDGLAGCLGVNHVAHWYLTHLLSPSLKASSSPRLVSVASIASFFGSAAPAPSGWYERFRTIGPQGLEEYANSKFANLLLVHELRQRSAWLTAVAINPGGVATKLLRHVLLAERVLGLLTQLFIKTPEEGAWTLISAGLERDLQSGQYFCDSRLTPPPYQATEEQAKMLWNDTEKIIREWQEGMLVLK